LYTQLSILSLNSKKQFILILVKLVGPSIIKGISYIFSGSRHTYPSVKQGSYIYNGILLRYTCVLTHKLSQCLIKHYSIKAYERDPRILDYGTRGRKVTNLAHRPLYPWGMGPLNRKLDGSQGQSGRRGEDKFLTPPSFSPVASRSLHLTLHAKYIVCRAWVQRSASAMLFSAAVITESTLASGLAGIKHIRHGIPTPLKTAALILINTQIPVATI
jgi:hypothetical protein